MRSPTTLLLTIITSLFLLSACEDQSEDASNCRYYVQQDLDNEDYDSALARLTDEVCQDTYPDDEYLVDKGSAYLGKAGFTFTDILGAAIEEDSDGDALSAFTSAIAKLENSDSIENLELAEEAYNDYLGTTCSSINDKTTSQEGICLVQGVLSLSKTAIALDYFSGTGDTSIEESETLDLSICALQYSTNEIVDPECSVDSILVTFANPEGTVSKSFTLLTITDLDHNSEYFLEELSADPDTGFYNIVFTNGFCTNDFTKTDAVTENIFSNPNNIADDEISYICPSETADDQPVIDFLVAALNDAINNIESLAETLGASDGEIDEIQEAIDEFKEEILPGSSASDIDFTIDDIINYLDSLDV